MWKHALLILCILPQFLKITEGENITAFSTNTTDEVVKKIPGRIVNGTKAFLGQFPQQVSLRRRYSQAHFCGGAILTSSWVLTAGHCMFDKSKNVIPAFSIIIVAGEIVLKNTNRARQWSYVKNFILHPDFNLESLYNDVALLRLDSTLVFDPYVKPVKITQRPYEAGIECQVSGWGYKQFEIPILSSTLMYVDVPLMPIDICRELLQNYTEVPLGSFCAGYLEGGRDACQGDSGGGLLCEGLLTGIVSGGEGCAWRRLPGLYSEVKYFVPWISQYVNLTETVPIRSLPFNRNFGSAAFFAFTFPRLFALACLVYFV